MAPTTQLSDRGSRQLNNQERAFVDHYLINFDARAAAIKAGYSAKSAAASASRLLKKPTVARALGKLLRDEHADRILEQGDILEQLYYIVTRDVREFVDDRGISLPINCLGDRAAQSVDGFEQEINEQINPETGEVTGRTIKNKLKLVGKAGAIEMAMKYRGLLAPEKQEININNEVKVGFDFSKLTQPPVKEDPVAKAFAELEAKGIVEENQVESPLVIEVTKNKDGTKTSKLKNGKPGVKPKARRRDNEKV